MNSNRRRHRLCAVALAFTICATAAGCTPRSDPIDHALPTCSETEQPIPVERLSEEKRWDCNLDGQSVVFPDGHVVSVVDTDHYEAIGNLVAYETIALGQYGAVAGMVGAEDDHPRWWGTKDGLDYWLGHVGRDSLEVPS